MNESKKLEEMLQAHIDGKVLFDAAGESTIPMKQVCREALAALREKDAFAARVARYLVAEHGDEGALIYQKLLRP